MKRFFRMLILISSFLYADSLPNTGLSQNEYGYYGEGVTFGGVPVVGKWRDCILPQIEFDVNGSASTGRMPDEIYYVNEAGTQLDIHSSNEHTMFVINEVGNNGCLKTRRYYAGDIASNVYPCGICKVTYGSKTYGSGSLLNIWVTEN